MPLAHDLNLQTSPFSTEATLMEEVLHAVLLNQRLALCRNLTVLSFCLSETTKESMTNLAFAGVTQTPASLCYTPHILAPVTTREHSSTSPEEFQLEHYAIKIL